LEIHHMAKVQKMVSIRLEADDYKFLSSLAEADKEDLSTAVRDLIARGRVLLALERYREGKASLGKAAEVAGVSISEMMDLLVEHGIPADLQVEDYRDGLMALRQAW
jgi:predicted HTH domain antitoxin